MSRMGKWWTDLVLFVLCLAFLERMVLEAPSELEQGVVAGGVFVLLALMLVNWVLDWRLHRRRQEISALRSKGRRLRGELDGLRQARNPELLN